jgi:hypothetical protein
MKTFIKNAKKALLEIGLAALLGLGFAAVSIIILTGIPLLWLHIFLRFNSITIHWIPIIIVSIIAFLFGVRYGIRYSSK